MAVSEAEFAIVNERVDELYRFRRRALDVVPLAMCSAIVVVMIVAIIDLRGSISTLETRLGDRIGTVEGRVGTLQGTMQQMDARLVRIEGQLDRLIERFITSKPENTE